MDRLEFEGDDLLRPLTPRGKKKARKAFRGLLRLYEKLDLIYSSRAIRARETAELLQQAFYLPPCRETEALNPGADFNDLRKLLGELPSGLETVALVGHEPDFSEMISGLIGRPPDSQAPTVDSNIEVKKGSCVEIHMVGPDTGLMANMLTPRVLRMLADMGEPGYKKK